MLALLPLYVVPASYSLHVYRPAYVICCNIGLVIVAIALAAKAARRNRLAGVALFALFLIASIRNRVGTAADGLHALLHPRSIHGQLQVVFENLALVRLLEQSSLPIVADGNGPYEQLDYYAGPALKARLNAVTDIRDLNTYPKSTSTQLFFLYAGRPLSYQVTDVASFLPTHSNFLLIQYPPDGSAWLRSYLTTQPRAGNVSFACLGPDCAGQETIVYDVHFTSMPVEAK
jgi:hypothetical protein